MSARPVNVPRLALSVGEACEALGIGWDFWREHIEPEVRVVRRGRRKLVATAELARWLDANAEAVLPEGTGGIPLTAVKTPANGGARTRRAPLSGTPEEGTR
jgi:hypothetical protein